MQYASCRPSVSEECSSLNGDVLPHHAVQSLVVVDNECVRHDVRRTVRVAVVSVLARAFLFRHVRYRRAAESGSVAYRLRHAPAPRRRRSARRQTGRPYSTICPPTTVNVGSA